MVAPNRFAAGIPPQRASSPGVRCAVVAIMLVAEQANWQDGCDLLTARSHGFQQGLHSLYRDEALWAAIRMSAFDRCAADWRVKRSSKVLVSSST
jgi:hypothetical protein